MVFKTMGDKNSRFFERMGIFGKSFSDIAKTPMSNKALKGFKDQYTYTPSSFKESFIANNLGDATKQVQKQAVEYARLINHQNLYYKQLQKGKITQKQYDAAITASNAKLKALTAQTDSLTFAQKASAATSKLAVGALNLFANVGISLAISFIISKIYEAVNSQKELREAAVDSANKIKEEISALNNLKAEYKAIVDSEKTAAEKTEELNSWKQTLIDTYESEENAIKNVNLEREKSLSIIDDLIAKEKIKKANEWLADSGNRESSTDANYKISAANDYASETDVVTAFGNYINSIESSDYDTYTAKFKKALEQFTKKQQDEFGENYVVTLNGESAYEQFQNLKELLNELSTIDVNKGLNESEKELYDVLLKRKENFEKVFTKDILDVFNSEKENLAIVKLFSFADSNNTTFKNVAADNYKLFRNELIKSVGDDKYLVDALEQQLTSNFPTLEKYFENLESAKQKFMAYEGTNKFNFLAELSPEDLETALKIPDLFRNGLDGAAKLIEEFKKKHPIELDVDTESIDEIAEKVANKTKLIKSAMTDMRDSGYISSATYAELVKEGGNFTECLEIQNGKLVLNIQKLKELEAQEYDNAIAANELAIAEMQASINSSYDYQRLQGKINELKEQKAFYLTAKEEILGVKPDDNNSGNGGGSTSEEPTQVTKFKKELAKKQHLVEMKELSEEDYLNWLDGAYKDAYAGLKDYDDDLYKYEEEIFSKRRELAEKVFNDTNESIEKEIESLEKLKENATLEADADGNIYSIIDQQIELYKQEVDNIKKRIAELEASGLIGIEDEIKELNTKREDLLDKIYDLGKERTTAGIDNEVNYLEDMKSKQNDFYDKQIEKLKEQKKLLEDKNDEEEKAKDLAEKQLNLRKAEIALEDARRNRNVLTYIAGGGVSYQTDKTAIAEAEEDVKKAQEDLAKLKQDEIADNLDRQIEILEEQKDKDSKYYDTVVKLLEDMSGKNKVQSESNLAIWNQLLATDAGQSAVAQIDPEILSGLLGSGFLTKNNGRFEIGVSSKLPTMSAADVIAFVGKTIGAVNESRVTTGYDQTSLNVQAATNERNGIVKSSVFNNSNVSQISIQNVDVNYSGNNIEDFSMALLGAAGNKVITLTNQRLSGTT